LDLALELAREATAVMAEVRLSGLGTQHKSGAADLVTLADTRVEALARERISARFPGHRIVGEEGGDTGAGENVWYLDPVDGTMNYARELPCSCFTCAYAEAGELRVGVVADPLSSEVFHAVSGEGAWLGETRLRLPSREGFAGSVILLELEGGYRPWPGMLELMAFFAEREATVRILGSSALALAQVAAGRAELFASGRLQPYDKAAGLLLIREAGGEIGSGALEPGAALAGVPALAGAVREALSARK
jgi:myo-inositol-1(or 4)-monophosphatase